jgi:predicted ATPase
MLKKVRIKNFLSCEDTEFDLEQITVLIGRNAAGKTNILKAIQWCSQFVIGNESISEYSESEMNPNCSIEFLIDNNFFKYDIDVFVDYREHCIDLIESLSCYENNEWKKISERDYGEVIHYRESEIIKLGINDEAPMINSLISLLPKKQLNESITKFFKHFSEIKYYILDDDEYKNGDNRYSYQISRNNYKQWLSKKNKSRQSVLMKLLHLWHEDKESLDELQALIGENGLSLIDKIEINEFDLGETEFDFYTIKFQIGNTTVNYTQLSYGTHRILVLLLALLYDKSTTLLIEQPEDGIHLGLLRKVLSICFTYAEAYNKQLIISTHSPKVINMYPAKSIRFVKMTEQGTKVTQLSEQELAIIPEYLNNEGALSDFIEAMDDE